MNVDVTEVPDRFQIMTQMRWAITLRLTCSGCGLTFEARKAITGKEPCTFVRAVNGDAYATCPNRDVGMVSGSVLEIGPACDCERHSAHQYCTVDCCSAKQLEDSLPKGGAS